MTEEPRTEAGRTLLTGLGERPRLVALYQYREKVCAIENEARNAALDAALLLFEDHADIRLPDGRLVIDLARVRLLLEEVRRG